MTFFLDEQIERSLLFETPKRQRKLQNPIMHLEVARF
jgi:hypothetical protein